MIYRQSVIGVLAPGPSAGWADVELSGECRNVDDHHTDGGFDWTNFPLA